MGKSKQEKRMKTIAFIVLFLVGVIEVTFGVILGQERMRGIETQFWIDLELSLKHSKAFSHYFNLLEDQWQVVAWLGLITILATGVLLWSLKRE